MLALTALLLVPACGGGGGGGKRGGGAPDPDANLSSFTVDHVFGVVADGVSAVLLETILVDTAGVPMAGVEVEYRVSGLGNDLLQGSVTDATGRVAGTLSSTASEVKTVRAIVRPGTADELELGSRSVTFVEHLPSTYYVRSSGSDANAGDSPLAAWRTLSHALSVLAPGDTLFVGAGTYAPVTIGTVATEDAPLVIRADRTGAFTGDAGDVVIDAGGTDWGVRIDGAFFVRLRGFSIRGAQPLQSRRGGGVFFDTVLNEHVSIQDCDVYENERGVDVGVARGLVLENNRISRNDGDGVVLGLTAGCLFLHNLVYGNGGAGLALEDVSLDLTVALSTFYRNSGDHFSERSSGSTGTIAYNVLSEGGADALGFSASTQLQPTYNLSWANAGIEVQRSGPDPDSIVDDPLFSNPFGPDQVLGGVGAADDDFRFLQGSAAFDAGDSRADELFLAHGGPVSRLTNRLDGLRDGEAPDGDYLNLGFHYPAPLDPYASLEEGGARVAWVLPGQVTLRTSRRDAAGDYAAPVRAQDANTEVKWVVHAVSPRAPVEFTAVLSDTGTRTDLAVRRWSGRLWSEDVDAPIASAIRSGNSGERGFDLELEGLSGDALLVRSNDGANPVYRTFSRGSGGSGGRWSQDAPVFSPALGTGTVLWVELVRQPGTDRIALVTLDDAQNLTAAIWDGDAWTNQVLLATQVVETREFQAFDAAWETLSGELLVVWGFSIFAEQARFATLDPAAPGGGTWQFGLHPSSEAIGAQVELASDPTSDRIAAAFGEGDMDDDVTVAIWDGTTFVHTAEVALQGVFGQHSIDVGWVGETGHAFVLWRDQGQGGDFMTARFRDSWRIEAEKALPGVGACIQTEIRGVPGTNTAEVVLLDAAGSLFSCEVSWGGTWTDWRLRNGGLPIDSGLDMMRRTKSFAFDLRRP